MFTGSTTTTRCLAECNTGSSIRCVLRACAWVLLGALLTARASDLATVQPGSVPGAGHADQWIGQVHMLVTSYADGDEHILTLQVEDGPMLYLQCSDDVADCASGALAPGNRVAVWGTAHTYGDHQGPMTVTVIAFELLHKALLVLPYTAAAVQPGDGKSAETKIAATGANTFQLSVLILLLDLCGDAGRAAATPEDIQYALFGNNVPGRSVSESYRYCSGGLDVLTPGSTKILGPIQVPCSGTGSRGDWSTNNCRTLDLYGMSDHAIEEAKKMLAPEEFDSFHHMVTVMPRNWKQLATAPECQTFVASAEYGPSVYKPDGSYGYSYVWMAGEQYMTKSVYMHELGHNLWLGHAGARITNNGEFAGSSGGALCDYCDRTCALGYCCSPRCPNGPHMLKLGWAAPVAGGALELARMAVGVHAKFDLPAQSSAKESLVSIDATQGDKEMVYVVSFRISDPNFDVLDRENSGVSHVHMYLGGPARTTTADTLYLGRLDVWQPRLVDEMSGLVFEQEGVRGSTATVSVCRASLDQLDGETQCWDGLDNDCDGQADADDRDCKDAPPQDKSMERRGGGVPAAQGGGGADADAQAGSAATDAAATKVAPLPGKQGKASAKEQRRANRAPRAARNANGDADAGETGRRRQRQRRRLARLRA